MNRVLFLCMVFTANLVVLSPVHAEQPSGENAAQKESASGQADIRKRYYEALTKVSQQAEIQKLRANLDTAQKEYSAAVTQALEEIDPQIEQEFQSLQNTRAQRKHPQPLKKNMAYDELTEQQKKHFSEIRKQAMESPVVKDARKKRNQATTEAERLAAETAYRDEIRKAMIALDPEQTVLINQLYGTETEATPETKP